MFSIAPWWEGFDHTSAPDLWLPDFLHSGHCDTCGDRPRVPGDPAAPGQPPPLCRCQHLLLLPSWPETQESVAGWDLPGPRAGPEWLGKSPSMGPRQARRLAGCTQLPFLPGTPWSQLGPPGLLGVISQAGAPHPIQGQPLALAFLTSRL